MQLKESLIDSSLIRQAGSDPQAPGADFPDGDAFGERLTASLLERSVRRVIEQVSIEVGHENDGGMVVYGVTGGNDLLGACVQKGPDESIEAIGAGDAASTTGAGGKDDELNSVEAERLYASGGKEFSGRMIGVLCKDQCVGVWMTGVENAVGGDMENGWRPVVDGGLESASMRLRTGKLLAGILT